MDTCALYAGVVNVCGLCVKCRHTVRTACMCLYVYNCTKHPEIEVAFPVEKNLSIKSLFIFDKKNIDFKTSFSSFFAPARSQGLWWVESL